MLLGALFDSGELVPPIAFELARPVVQWFEVLRVRAIERLTAVTTHVDEADIAQHPQVLRNRWLRKAQRTDDVTAGPVARVHLPQRVPDGFHGNWMPDPS